jgi:hypothetical protein
MTIGEVLRSRNFNYSRRRRCRFAFRRFLMQLFLRPSNAMKCATHHSEAVAVCAWCGRALCADCAKPSPTQRMVCSDNCAAALTRADRAMELILQKSLQSAQASAFYSYLCGGFSAAGAVGAYFYLPAPFLIWFCAGCSLVFIASGIWYGRIARKNPEP